MKTMRYSLAALLACAATATRAEEVQLTVWSDTARIAAYEAFDAAHDSIALDIVTVAPAEQTAKLQLALRSGDGVPDAIFMAELTQIAQLSTRRSDYLMDLTGMIGQDVIDGFLPNALSPCMSADGRLLCLRNDLAHFILWYDKHLMDELGFAVPTTWEEFEEIGHAAAAEGYIVGSGTEGFPLLNVLASAGCVLGFPEGGDPNTVRVDLTGATCRAGAEMVDRMRASGALSRQGTFEPAFVQAAKDGQLLMFVGPTWYGEHVLRPLYEIDPGRIAAAPSLSWAGQDQAVAWSWGGGVFGGYTKTAHPDEVAALLAWMTTDTELQGQATTMPADAASSEVWRNRIVSDPYYASDQVYDVMKTSAAFGHAHYAGYRFDVAAALVKIDADSDVPLADKLEALQNEIVNLARVNRYTVVN